MKILIDGRKKKLKQVGIRLTEDEYRFISEFAKKHQASRSYVAETLIRAAMAEMSKVETKNQSNNEI